MDIVQLAKDVERKKLEYDKAVRALAEALGPSSFSAPPERPRPRPKGPPVSQRVLELVQADPDGRTRAQLIQELGNPGAIHSALKKHKAEGLIESVDGRWRVVRPAKKGRAGAPAPAP